MDNAAVLFLLRAIHIVGGVLWVGGVVLLTFFLLPATQALGPAAQPVMQFIMGRRKLSIYLMVLGILTTLAGLLLMARNVSNTNGAWARSPMGIGMCGPVLIGHGSPEQKAFYLPRMLTGEPSVVALWESF